MKLIYISNVNDVLEGKISIIDSQVIELLNFYSENNLVREIILLAGINSKTKLNNNLNNVLSNKIKIIYFNSFPDYPLVNFRTKNAIYKALSKIENLSDYIIHARLETYAIFAHKSLLKLKISTSKIIADIRGVAYTETLEYSKKNYFVKKLKLSSKKNQLNYLSKIANISTVSNALKQYLVNEVNLISDRIQVIPCIAGSNFKFNSNHRNQIRKELEVLDDEFLIIHVTGGDSDWQNTNEVMHFFSKFNLKILNLSKKQFDLPNVINRFIPYTEVSKYLSASDAALIWRNKSVTNFVSSPVKFSEYACNGLPTITNQNIDSITTYINKENCGLIIENLEDFTVDLILPLMKIDRENFSIIGNNNFGVKIIAEKYINYYSKIN